MEPKSTDYVNKRQIAERLGIGLRKTNEVVGRDYWPAPIEFAPRILRWRWSEIEAALAHSAPRRTVRKEPQKLRDARERAAA